MRAVLVVLLALAACASACASENPAPRDVSDFCGIPESACGRRYVDEHGRSHVLSYADAGRE